MTTLITAAKETNHYLSVWQVLKKSVCGNVLGANVLKRNGRGKPTFSLFLLLMSMWSSVLLI